MNKSLPWLLAFFIAEILFAIMAGTIFIKEQKDLEKRVVQLDSISVHYKAEADYYKSQNILLENELDRVSPKRWVRNFFPKDSLNDAKYKRNI